LQEEPFAAVCDTFGLWSVTLGPFAAGIHSYSFEVNGVRTIKPQNMRQTTGDRCEDPGPTLPRRPKSTKFRLH